MTVQKKLDDLCFTFEDNDQREEEEEDQHISMILWNRIQMFRYMYMFVFMCLYSICTVSYMFVFASSIINIYHKCATCFFVHLFYQCLYVYILYRMDKKCFYWT